MASGEYEIGKMSCAPLTSSFSELRPTWRETQLRNHTCSCDLFPHNNHVVSRKLKIRPRTTLTFFYTSSRFSQQCLISFSISPLRMSCKTCLGKFFGILGSNIFFVALVAMVAAVFTQRWAVSSQRDVSVAGMPTNADLQFGIFDMSARVMQEGKVQWSQYSYTWCNAKETTDDGVSAKAGC